ncbi:Dipeptide transport system permease protein DppB [Candidatus Clavichlamydia salmonicola]|uniref:ABC transporter permease n=1 Tax=Candidatus Clavichlamydia salmonicola TaxID=469812 RepID=UPI001E625B4F|nr:ABC transporter permease [Candidatus Clavichlamydia salmonicola]MBF5051175.1 Dipeptide transport system permease protein DppB [Candidatus Clavichlamydia salmonicola]
MKKFLLKRFLANFFNLWIILTLTFILTKIVPGDPFSDEMHISPQAILILKKHYHLDRSMMFQYGQCLKNFFTWNYGSSLTYPNRTTGQIIFSAFPVSMKLGLAALTLALFIGLPIGIYSGMQTSRKKILYFLIGFCIASAVPYFTLAAILQYIFAFKYSFLPLSGWGNLSHMILPVITLAFFPCTLIARFTQVATKDVMQETFISAAYAKGLSSFTIMHRHIFPFAILPVISYSSVLFTGLLTGSFIVETMFGIPGIGCWFVNAVGNRDYPLIMGLTIFYGTLLVSLSLLADVIYCLIDPRLRRSI